MIYDNNSGIEQFKNKGSFLLLFCWIDSCGLKGARRKAQAEKKPPPEIKRLMVPVGRSVGRAGFLSGE